MQYCFPFLLVLTLLLGGCAPSAAGSPALSSPPAASASSEASPEAAGEEAGDSADAYSLDTVFFAGGRELTVRLHGSIHRSDGYERCGVHTVEILEGDAVLQTLSVKDAIDAAYAADGLDNDGDEDRTQFHTAESGLALDDLDFDGYPDLRLIRQAGNVNFSWLCWLWDVGAGQFRYAFSLTGYDLTLDAERRQLITEGRYGWGLYYTDRYQYDREAGVLRHVGQTVDNHLFESRPVQDDALVGVWEYLPVDVDLKYASADNFTGEVIYDSPEARLRFGTLKKLKEAQDQLGEEGFRLLIWDAYRPVEAQYRLWELCPDPTYVSDPNRGFSRHSRGNTVDVTLVTLDGEALEMPSGFDEFSPLADRDYSDVSPAARENAERLERAMTAAGFQGYSGEWWHYSDTADYPVIR